MKPTKEQLKQWSNDPENWKYGMFYYNKEDKRIFPPKKMAAMGWTTNFANPKSLAVFILIILLAPIISMSLIYFFK